MISMEGTGTGRGRTRRTDTGMIDILEMIGAEMRNRLRAILSWEITVKLCESRIHLALHRSEVARNLFPTLTSLQSSPWRRRREGSPPRTRS